MRLRSLDLTRYGKFTGQTLDFGMAKPDAPDLHIVYGLNEAGKSTALSAYLDLLFGIENTSRYGFLHPYSTMQVGGHLEFDGAGHELVRVKARINSLLDGQGQSVNEALLSVPLAGLTRENYRAMFSLDDQSLEDGGNAIIASKGELGELLFAASAGLADLGATLAKVRDEADAIHKQRGRVTQIAELKRTLADLKTERDSIDTRASAHAALVAALARANKAHAESIHNQADARARHEEIARLLRAAPLAVDYRLLRVQITQLGTGAAPPTEWAGQLSGLMIRNAELGTQIAGTEADLKRLEAEITAFVVDDSVIKQGAAILGFAEGMARFSTAEADLPRRQAAILEDEAAIAAVLNGVGQAGHSAPETLLLPAAPVGTLRDLIERRSGIVAKAETARQELTHAQDSFDRATRDLDTHAGGNVANTAILDGVFAALGTLRRSDHQARMRIAERELPVLSRRYHALRDGLLPWCGEGDALRTVRLPEPRQIDGWRLRVNTIHKGLTEHGEKRRDLESLRYEETARLSAIRTMAGAIDDTEAHRLRAVRDAAWETHAKILNSKSAAEFLAALQTDDTLAAARLAHVQDLAELRSLQKSVAVTEASLLRHEDLLAELDNQVNALASEVGPAVESQITLAKAGPVTLWLDEIENWTRRRTETLIAWDALQTSESDLAAAKADLARDLTVLAEAMALAGFEAVDELSPNVLMQAAESVLTQGGSQQATRAAAERGLRERESDLLVRERALAEAEAASAAWQQDWTLALGQTWFTDTGVGAVRELIHALAELPAALTQRDARARQIETMARDQHDFVQALGAVLAALGETFDSGRVVETARVLIRRHDTAEQDRRLQGQKTAERSRLNGILGALKQDLAVHLARTGEMTAFFGVETLPEVSARMEEIAERDRLTRRLEALGHTLIIELRADSLDAALAQLAALDLGETERAATETAARLDGLETTTRQSFADRSRAIERLDAVGGDDAVARIETKRRTVLLQIEDKAMDYLRLRTGTLVAEKALRAYRDQHRSSMMEQASEAFALITRGEYNALAAQPDKDRETLIGLSRQGGSKLAADMSKGTQFQLFLALRLAGYQEFARSRPTVPFIADDIMETFDEPRSEQVFRLLGEMARIGQVIYLTHHRHLCEMAKTVIPTVTVHELSG